jgi:hypothetical protein
MELDLARIKKISIISIVALFVIELVCFFITSRQIFLSILVSGVLTFIFFIGTLFFYFRAYRNKSPNILKYILPIFVAKIVFSGLAFFFIYRFDYINMLGFLFSFLIFFTIFFNLEIFLIYKKVLFYKN